MKIPFNQVSLMLGFTLFFMVSAETGRAQSTGEFKQHMVKWWQDYTVFMKKALAEPSDQKLIAMFRTGATGLIADHKKLYKETVAWKKSHTAKELEDLDKWMEAEPHQIEMEKLAEDPKVMERNENNKELLKAVQEFRMAMMRP